jgi:hypothetical protein
MDSSERLLLGALVGAGGGLLLGAFLPPRWSLSLVIVATVGFMGYLLTHVQDRPEIIMEYFLIFFIILPQLVLPVWVGLGAGYALRRWTATRLLLRALATAGVAAALYGLFELGRMEPRWKKDVEASGAAFVKSHPDVLSRAGAVRTANMLGATSVTGAELPYSQLQFFVRGEKGDLVVEVGVTGARASPAFHITSIQRTP